MPFLYVMLFCNAFCHALCLNRPSLICSFYFTKRCTYINFNCLYYLLMSPSLLLSLSLSLSLFLSLPRSLSKSSPLNALNANPWTFSFFFFDNKLFKQQYILFNRKKIKIFQLIYVICL